MVGMFNIKAYDIARTQNGDILIASTDSVLRVIPRGKTHIEFSNMTFFLFFQQQFMSQDTVKSPLAQ